jgi:ATP-dependent Lon protease
MKSKKMSKGQMNKVSLKKTPDSEDDYSTAEDEEYDESNDDSSSDEKSSDESSNDESSEDESSDDKSSDDESSDDESSEDERNKENVKPKKKVLSEKRGKSSKCKKCDVDKKCKEKSNSLSNSSLSGDSSNSDSCTITSQDSMGNSVSMSDGSIAEKRCKKKIKSKVERSCKVKNKKRKNASLESEESDSDFSLNKKSNNRKMSNEYNIILNGYRGMDDGYESEDEEIERSLNDKNEECGSDDEKMFMKETYVDLPKGCVSMSKSKGSNKIRSQLIKAESDVYKEYKELQDLKKLLVESMKNPKNKILQYALDKCKNSINKLVKNSRTKNAKEYYALTKAENDSGACEIDYFKKKCSYKEQINIMNELKEINKHMNIDKPYRLLLLESKIPPNYKATVLQKLNGMKMMEPSSSEYHKMKTWVDTFMRVPFGIYRSLSVNIGDGMMVCNDYMVNAKRTLDDCVYGMEDTKLQILQMIGQWITNPSAMGTAIAIYGDKGCGKTSIVKDGISKILGREFAFIALGGAGDSSFLEGHSYTYEGSVWGKIVQILIDSKCMNPVIYFDELDKVSNSSRGSEITSILTHLTDSTQNNQFHDKYFSEIDFDLSKCLFIFSYNDESSVNPILRDRMYRIQVKGYDTKDKIIIAKKYLLPKIREQVNFREGDIIIPDDVISYIVTNASMTQNEQGVRNLKRCLEIIYTKLNLFRLIDESNTNMVLGKALDMEVKFPFTVSKKNVDTFIKNEQELNQSVLAMYV